ncbi:MAG TPA: hypothetical protein VFR23_22235, partial [Jiangellaceae bacterium]|nr:hypothetical protein [Jiangellaceae bacterium]
GADGVLGPPVGRLHPVADKEGEQRVALSAQVVQELAVGRVGGLPGDLSTLGVVGERGSRREGRSPARSR